MATTPEQTYSFTAVFEDGTIIEQEDDSSNLDPAKSRFFDILEKEKESKLTEFVIHNPTQSLGLDLRDGHFEINGVPFWQHRPDLENYKDFRIIYYRTVQRVMSQETMKEISAQVTGHTVGWQVTHNGENIKRTVTI